MIEILKEHIAYRSQVLKLAWFDVVKTYKGTVFGWIWMLIKPIITIFVYWFAFTYGLKSGKSVNGFPYIIWLISGIIPWFFMSDILSVGINCLKKNSYLVNKIKFPLSVIPTFDTISKFITHIVLIGLFTVIYAFGFGIDIYFLQFPFIIVLFFLYWNIFSLGASFLSAISRDFYNLVKSFTTAIFWLSGIMWPISNINNSIINTILLINPVTFFAQCYRKVFVYKEWIWSDSKTLLIFVFVFIFTLLFSKFVYFKTKDEVGDVI